MQRPEILLQPPSFGLRSTALQQLENDGASACDDEFTFRFNRRRSPMAAFQTLLALATLHGPTTYHRLYASESTG